jgi:hypothetical protein
MPCVGGADVDTVEEKRNLVEGATIDADVRLNTKAAALPDIYADGCLEEVVDGLRRRRFYLLAGDETYHAHRLQGCQRRHRPGDGDFREFLVVGYEGGVGSARGGLGGFDLGNVDAGEHADSEHPDAYFAMEAGENGVASAT